MVPAVQKSSGVAHEEGDPPSAAACGPDMLPEVEVRVRLGFGLRSDLVNLRAGKGRMKSGVLFASIKMI